MQNVEIEERILIGLFLCSSGTEEILQQLKPEWNEKINFSLHEKLLSIHYPLLFENVFPWKEELSEDLDHGKYSESFFIQPDLFLRLRPGHEETVKQKLSAEKINFNELSSTCIALPAASKIDKLIELDKEAVVQDYNSQRVGEFFPVRRGRVWDCCAASGGKSILLYDTDPNIDLTASDLRESILANLKKRFEKAGIKKYRSFVADLTVNPRLIEETGQERPTSSIQYPASGNFDLIICDAPCTGSGSWSRTPEQLYFFEDNKIDQYSVLQKQIVSNVIPHLGRGGFFIYITCSVFKKENEEIVDYIKSKLHLDLIKMELLKGWDKKADSMFVAVFRRT